MNCRDFQIEIEEGSALSQPAEFHLNVCPDCHKFHHRQVRLLEMLGGLPRVEVPKDFDFQLKARIAQTGPGGRQPSFFPALRYVLPLSVIVILLSIVALSGLYYIDQRSSIVPDSAEVIPAPATEKYLPKNVEPEPDEIASGNTPPPPAPVNPGDRPMIQEKRETIDQQTPEIVGNDKGGSRDLSGSKPKIIPQPENNDGGSRDFSVNKSEPINPPGLNTNRPIATPEIATISDITEVLDLIGIKADSENNRLTVKVLTKNSVAERSGVKIGDQIEAIDGNKISGEPLRGKSINVKTLTVVRNGQKKEITLQNQSN